PIYGAVRYHDTGDCQTAPAVDIDTVIGAVVDREMCERERRTASSCAIRGHEARFYRAVLDRDRDLSAEIGDTDDGVEERVALKVERHRAGRRFDEDLTVVTARQVGT